MQYTVHPKKFVGENSSPATSILQKHFNFHQYSKDHHNTVDEGQDKQTRAGSCGLYIRIYIGSLAIGSTQEPSARLMHWCTYEM